MNPIRIAIVDQTAAGWAAGGMYTGMLMQSLGAACRKDGKATVEAAPTLPARLLPGERILRQRLHLGVKSLPLPGELRLRRMLRVLDPVDLFAWAQNKRIDVLIPLLDLPPWNSRVATVGWIPDFQHVHLPQYFSESERLRRAAACRRLAERATRVLLSSQSVAAEFAAFAPVQVRKTCVISFPSVMAFSNSLSNNPGAAVRKFNLPVKFALVANQFWAHKNHQCVVAAVHLLSERGMTIPVVMTGLPADYRDPHNETLSRLLQAIAARNLAGRIIVLGRVRYSDLVDLMRSAAVIIQPSRCEGWSTVVQDSKALGRPLLCSDLPVHREQAPEALGFFGTDEPEALATLLERCWPSLSPGPGINESAALAEERTRAAVHGRAVLELCRECIACG